MCEEKSVLHLGATDSPYTKNSIRDNNLLHKDLEKVASHLVGMDIDIEMVEWLRLNQKIDNIRIGDIERLEDYPDDHFDIVVIGDILEHLSNPGSCLSALQQKLSSGTKLVITVPNAYSLKRFLRALSGAELIHPDHVLHHSPYTIKALVERYNFSVENYFSFISGGSGILARVSNKMISFKPQLAEGIGIVCRSN